MISHPESKYINY